MSLNHSQLASQQEMLFFSWKTTEQIEQEAQRAHEHVSPRSACTNASSGFHSVCRDDREGRGPDSTT